MFFNLEAQAEKDVDAIRAFTLTPTGKNAPAPIDDFRLELTNKEYELMSDAELCALPFGSTMLFDAELYENYFLVAFKSLVNSKVLLFEETDNFNPNSDLRLYLDRSKLKWVMETFCTVGYNSRDFDVPIIRVSLQGYGTRQLKGLSNQIIFDGLRSWDIEKKYELPRVNWNHVDLIEVAPLQGSLKLYAGRLHCKRMQDLPYEHDSILTPEEIAKLTQYCINDLDNTGLLLADLSPQLELRAEMSNEYGIDLRSRSDAQIAEHVIVTALTKMLCKKIEKPSIPPGKKYYYVPPKFIHYQSPVLREMFEVLRRTEFVVGDSGSIEMPKELSEREIKLGGCVYRMGIGGLHSSEKSVAHFTDDNYFLVDRDVASYYPAIVLNNKYCPKHLGEAFLIVYKSLVDKRVVAKKRAAEIKKELKDTSVVYLPEKIAKLKAEMKACEVIADSIKITINGTFGKTGNKYSKIYSPELLFHITVTGQLCLLLLIEMLELNEIPVVSGNTDGVLIKCPRSSADLMHIVVGEWERITGFTTEEALYKAVYSRDVNNYIAIKDDNTVKVKGAYSEKGSGGNTVLSKNPENLICNDAVSAFLTKATPVDETIRRCADIRRFVTVRNVKGGAIKSGNYLGKTIRWYYSTEMKGEINYKLSGNKVPNSDGAKPLMELPETLPADVDYDRYIEIANNILKDIAAV